MSAMAGRSADEVVARIPTGRCDELYRPICDDVTLGEHLRSMIGFNQQRLDDFTKSLASIKATMPEGEVKDIWITKTQENIDLHRNEIAQREAELAELGR